MNATIPVASTETLTSDLQRLHTLFMANLGKVDKPEALAAFMDDDTLSEDARLIAAEQVELAFHGLFAGERVWAYGIGLMLDVPIMRARLLANA